MSDYITPVMYLDSTGHSWESFWNKVAAGAAIVGTIAGIALIVAVPGFGAAIGTVLLTTSVGSLIGGAQSVKNGGSYLAGAAGGAIIGFGLGVASVAGGGLLLAASSAKNLLSIGYAIGGVAAGLGFGYLGGYSGNSLTQHLNKQSFNKQSAYNSGALFAGMGLIAAVGGSIVSGVFSTVGVTETSYLVAGGFAVTISIGVEIITDTFSYLVELYSN